jgi:hypothetical protein
MTDKTAYTPPKVWTWNKESGGRFANINRPVAGSTHDEALPVGRHPLQHYSLATPNGVKVTVMLEELLTRGHAGEDAGQGCRCGMKGGRLREGHERIVEAATLPGVSTSLLSGSGRSHAATREQIIDPG